MMEYCLKSAGGLLVIMHACAREGSSVTAAFVYYIHQRSLTAQRITCISQLNKHCSEECEELCNVVLLKHEVKLSEEKTCSS